MIGIVGRKKGMTQIFSENGRVIPVTVIQVEDCYVVGHRTEEGDGYRAVRIAYHKKKRVPKPVEGILKKAGIDVPLAKMVEFRVDDPSQFEIGKKLNVDIFEVGEKVDITGTTKGRGFAGVMKRWGFAGAPDSHGANKCHRRPGSIGATSTPGRVLKGKKMPGHYGVKRKTVLNLEVAYVNPESGVIAVKGAVPGWKNGFVVIKKKG